MLRTVHLFVFMVMIAAFIFIAGCQGGSSKDTFPEVGKRLSKSVKQINNQPGIVFTGFAADPKGKSYQVLIKYDPSQISSEQLKQIVTDYLNHAASNSTDWKEMLKPYQLRIEKLGNANKLIVIAKKDIGSTEIKWLFE